VDEALNHATALPLGHVMQQSANTETEHAGHSAGNFIILLMLLTLILQLPAAPGWSSKITPLVLTLAGVVVLLKNH